MMRHRTVAVVCLVLLIVLASVGLGLAQDLKPVQLAPPQTDGGKPLMQALKESDVE